MEKETFVSRRKIELYQNFNMGIANKEVFLR
jgi:hypothetical protein